MTRVFLLIFTNKLNAKMLLVKKIYAKHLADVLMDHLSLQCLRYRDPSNEANTCFEG